MSRAANVLIAGLLLVVTLPLFVAVAVAILLESGGPIFYRARRVGLNGTEFEMLKFRKMRNDASGPRLTQRDDERFTGVGGVLAKTKLDELPQLINVLAGDMALVGPRPEDPQYVRLFEEEFAPILSVRPGITGLTQLTYVDEGSLLLRDDFESYYRKVLLPRKIESDRFYVDHKSTTLDLKILTRTALASLGGFNLERSRNGGS